MICTLHIAWALELFGSAADGGAFDPRTGDRDFLVEFGELSRREYADVYSGLLEDLLQRLVDRVMNRATRNPNF